MRNGGSATVCGQKRDPAGWGCGWWGCSPQPTAAARCCEALRGIDVALVACCFVASSLRCSCRWLPLGVGWGAPLPSPVSGGVVGGRCRLCSALWLVGGGVAVAVLLRCRVGGGCSGGALWLALSWWLASAGGRGPAGVGGGVPTGCCSQSRCRPVLLAAVASHAAGHAVLRVGERWVSGVEGADRDDVVDGVGVVSAVAAGVAVSFEDDGSAPAPGRGVVGGLGHGHRPLDAGAPPALGLGGAVCGGCAWRTWPGGVGAASRPKMFVHTVPLQVRAVHASSSRCTSALALALRLLGGTERSEGVVDGLLCPPSAVLA